MATRTYGFDEDSTRRIGRVVRTVERQAIDVRGQRGRRRAGGLPPYIPFVCTLATGSGASLGSQTTLPDFTYLISIGTTDYPGEKTPEFYEQQYGLATASATKGLAYFDSDGNLHLLQALYTWSVTPCTAPA